MSKMDVFSDVNVSQQLDNCKLYKRRWTMLGVFVLYAIVSGCQWPQYVTSKTLVTKYYGVSPQDVEWTCLIYMCVYILEMLPATFLMNKIGIRKSLIIAGVGCCLGAWIKAFAVNPDRFYLVMIGQTIVAISTVMKFGLAACISSTWFGSTEISLANSIALFGDVFGAAIGFVLLNMFIGVHKSMDAFESGLKLLNFLIAISESVIVLFIIFFFQNEPKKPPSVARIIQTRNSNKGIWTSLKSLMTGSFALILISYGTILGSFTTINVMLETLVNINFKDNHKDAGYIGFLMTISGMMGIIIGGYVLDRTKQFKIVANFISLTAFISMMLFSYFLKSGSIFAVYITASVLGFTAVSYYTVGIQLALEVTYPVSESVSSGMLLLIIQVAALIITSLYSWKIQSYGDVIANRQLCVLLLVGVVATLLIPNNMKRLKVERKTTKHEANKMFLMSSVNQDKLNV